MNCQRACKKCDDGRPCSRCVKYGIESTCENSSRKERKRGFKRGPYKTTKGPNPYYNTSPGSDTSAFLSTDGSSPVKYSVGERPSRSARRRVNYREALRGEESESQDSGGELEEWTSSVSEVPIKESNEDNNRSKSRSTSRKNTMHMPLFKMVMSTMHGDLVISKDHPTLRDLALICTELLQHEREASVVVKTDPAEIVERERQMFNHTPVGQYGSPVLRDIPTPPTTPTMSKPTNYHLPTPHLGSVFSPMPISTAHTLGYPNIPGYYNHFGHR